MNNYVYILDGKAYVNLTNRCHNACTFCIKNTGDNVAGTPLLLTVEPTADDVMTAFDGLKDKLTSDEVVFCGFGEPTERLSVLKECAARFKAMGYRTRLNTNGLGSLTNGRDISSELADIDIISVSLNSSTAQGYADITRSYYKQDAFYAMLAFAERTKACGIDTRFTVVDVIGKSEVEECRKIADSLGIPLRVRAYISDNYNG